MFVQTRNFHIQITHSLYLLAKPELAGCVSGNLSIIKLCFIKVPQRSKILAVKNIPIFLAYANIFGICQYFLAYANIFWHMPKYLAFFSVLLIKL